MKTTPLIAAGTALMGVMLSIVSCQKEITVDLPTSPPRIVVEGSIEQDLPPIILLTWSQGYFEPTDLQSIENLFVRDADVRLSNGLDTIPLDLFCTAELGETELALAAELLGTSPEALQAFNICLYTTFDQSMWGEVGRTYTLLVDYEDHHLKSSTRINELVALDSIWFQIPNEDPDDSLGLIFATLTDPDTTGNAYRWFARRINRYPDWVPDEELRGQVKDAGFIAPLGSVFDDNFFNGLSFEFSAFRGSLPNSVKFDDSNDEDGYFKRGDTVVVRGCVIDRGVFRFIQSLESQVSNQGSPFALPYNLQSNVSGGLGVFAGYGASYDTVVCE
ncbi:MAG: DUF4249 domain-containing protein [Flavobacteriales bacterium]